MDEPDWADLLLRVLLPEHDDGTFWGEQDAVLAYAEIHARWREKETPP